MQSRFWDIIFTEAKDQFCPKYSAIWQTEALGMSHLFLSFFRQKPHPLARATYRSLSKRKLEIVDEVIDHLKGQEA
jgi:hypothetical protein